MVDFQRDVWCVLGLPFDAVDMSGTVRIVRQAAAERRPCIIATPNLNFIVGCQRDKNFRDAVLQCDLSIPDGMPEVWVARLLGIPIRRRVAGSNMFDALRADTSECLSVYFFGGTEGVAETAHAQLNATLSGLKCVGFESPGFVSVEEMSGEDSIARINASGADFLVVALGAEKGHAWIERNRRRITVPVISHLGAVVNFLAGGIKRAPMPIQKCGLEWLWRIKEEPALWRRYFRDGLMLVRLLATRVLPYVAYLTLRSPDEREYQAAAVEAEDDAKLHILRLRGAWTRKNIAPLRDCLSRAARSGKDVRLELSGVTYVDAAFVGLLQLLHGHQKQLGRRLLVDARAPAVRKVINYCCAEHLYGDTESPSTAKRLRFLNGDFDRVTLPQTVDRIFGLLAAGQRGWLSTVNVAYLMMMRSDARLQSFVDRSALVVADGQPLVWCAPWFGGTLPERVTGVDLVEVICERAAREGKRVYFLGADRNIVTVLAGRLRQRYPDLQLDCADGYFGKEEAPLRADRIRACGTDILFVGMGVPRQEYFIEDHWDRLGVGMAIGVGGSFDVLAGLRARAPMWVQTIGMEWFFRLIQEPRRLLPRYLVTNSQFVWLVLRARLRMDKAS